MDDYTLVRALSAAVTDLWCRRCYNSGTAEVRRGDYYGPDECPDCGGVGRNKKLIALLDEICARLQSPSPSSETPNE